MRPGLGDLAMTQRGGGEIGKCTEHAYEGLTRVGFKSRADHGHHGGLAVASYAVLQDACQLAVSANQYGTCNNMQ